jgi:hypothetical protein
MNRNVSSFIASQHPGKFHRELLVLRVVQAQGRSVSRRNHSAAPPHTRTATRPFPDEAPAPVRYVQAPAPARYEELLNPLNIRQREVPHRRLPLGHRPQHSSVVSLGAALNR